MEETSTVTEDELSPPESVSDTETDAVTEAITEKTSGTENSIGNDELWDDE